MKIILTSFVCILSFSLTAATPNTTEGQSKNILKCVTSSSYNKTKISISIDLDGASIQEDHQKDKQWVISWSESECEDHTELVFLADEYKLLRAGKMIEAYAQVHHEEPDIQLKGTLTCRFK
jgi:hypothetical protein